MPTVLLKSTAFEALEIAMIAPGVTWSQRQALQALVDGDSLGNPKVLQLSASLIRISQAFFDYSTFPAELATYELRLSGNGISPVSSLDALLDAINNGLSLGTLNKLEILRAGSSVLALTMDSAGYHLASGDVVVTLAGSLPLSFTQFADIAQLFDQVVNIDSLTRSERAALFTDLTAYSATGLSLTDGGNVLFAVAINATAVSLTLNGLTLSATGTFPANLGQDIEALWNLLGSGQPLHVTGFAGLTFTGLRLTDAGGRLLGSVTDPLADTPQLTKVDGKFYDDVQVGENYNDWMSGFARESHMLAGLDGQDTLLGGIKADHLMGGLSNDSLSGFGGADRLDGGRGRDVLAGGAGTDVFHFDLLDGIDRITDFTPGEDVIEILDAARLRDLVLTKVGQDVQVDYRSIHVLVEGVTLNELSHGYNFQI